ncbi:MAG: selenocysteine-specific elongation factor [Solirubrobacteraceae bacterium]|nr:selenocysteine-specific elongation factor [Solirubrobacteraceae bacterium]
MSHAPLVLGTAGHIDHGKTALVARLTGVDTDRLPEERRRGISIALGYAALTLPSGRPLSVVDVPGHERFVRTMVAGATGVDLFLLTIAADDGVMPQTREHLAVLRGLGIGLGAVAVTKADLADPAAALAQARELVPEAPAVAVSARTGAGIEELLAALDAVAGDVAPTASRYAEPARLHVDRVFSVRGAGTVVTGTLWAGALAPRDEVELLPARRRARVREVQVHDARTERAVAGQRVALNLAGVRRDEVAPGDLVAGRDAGVRPAHIIDVALNLSDDRRPEHGDRVQVHHGTRAAPGRVAELGGRYWQLRLERPLLCAAGDRLIVRRIAPPDTLGGGVVLEAPARRHGARRDVLARLVGLERGDAAPAPADPPPDPEPVAQPPRPLSPAALAAEARLRAAGHEPPLDAELPAEEAAELPALRAAGRAVRAGRAMHFHREALDLARERVVALAQGSGEITLAQLRDELGTSRKYAQALLERFDAEKLTLRRGDVRVLRRR